MKLLVLILLLVNMSVGLVIYGGYQDSQKAQAKIAPSKDAEILQIIKSDTQIGDIGQSAQSAQASDNAASRSLSALPSSDLPRDCLILGPFAEGFRADAVVTMLNDEHINAKKINKKTENSKVPYSYRVYIPSLPSFEEAQKVAQQLSAAKINDYYVITRSDDKVNGISLGVYTRKQGVLERQTQVMALGHQVEYEMRERDQPMAAWVQFSTNADIPPAKLEQIKRQGVEPKLLPVPCE